MFFLLGSVSAMECSDDMSSSSLGSFFFSDPPFLLLFSLDLALFSFISASEGDPALDVVPGFDFGGSSSSSLSSLLPELRSFLLLLRCLSFNSSESPSGIGSCDPDALGLDACFLSALICGQTEDDAKAILVGLGVTGKDVDSLIVELVNDGLIEVIGR